VDLLHTGVLHDLSEHATIATAHNQHLLGRHTEREQRQMCDHLLVRELITFGHLDDTVQHQHGTVGLSLKDQDVLELRAAVGEHLVNLNAKLLT